MPRASSARRVLGFTGVGWLAVGAVMVGLGASPRDGFLIGLGLVIQWASGAVIWMAIRRGSAPFIEALGIGSALGAVLAVLAGVAGNAVVTWAWWWLLPSIVAVGVWWRARPSLPSANSSSNRVDAGWRSPWWPALAGVGVGLVLVFLNLRRYPLSWQGVWDGYHPDIVFFEALSYSVADYGPSNSIFMVGGDIRYHWLTYAWSGQLSTAFDAAPFMVLTRALPLVALIGLVLLAITMVDLVARDLPNRYRVWARWLAVALVIPGGYLGAVNGTILNFDSPSQALTSAWVMAWTVMVLVVITTGASRVWLWSAVAVMAFAITGGKVSAGAVIAAGIGFAAVIGVITRKAWWRVAFVAAVLTGVAVVLAFVLFAWGSASPGDLRFLDWNGRASTIQGLNSSPGTRGVALGTLGLLLAMSARWAGGVFLLASASWRERIEPWLGLGFVLAAALPVVLFAQGVNETWFALTASGPLAVLSAVGVVVGWQRAALGSRPAVAALGAGLLGFLAVSFIWTDQVWESGFGRFWSPWLGYAVAGTVGLVGAVLVVARGNRPRAAVTFFALAALVLVVEAALSRGTPIVAAAVGGARDGAGVRTAQLADPGLVGASELAAVPQESGADDQQPSEPAPEARPVHAWSVDHAAAADFLRSQAADGDAIVTNEVDAFLVPALTRVQTYISGAPYQSLYGSSDTAALIPGQLETNALFLGGGDPETVNQVCAAGAQWVWLSSDRDPLVDPLSLGAVAFSNDSVTIIELDSTCPR